MADQDLTSLDEQKPDGAVDQILTLDEAEQETRRKLKAWADVEHDLATGGHTIRNGPNPPAVPTYGQMWFKTDTMELLIYRDDVNVWVTAQQPTFNYLYNCSFSRFFNAAAVPIGWAPWGTSTTGTIFPSGVGLADTHQKFGPYALAVNSGNGTLNAFQHVSQLGSMFTPPWRWYNRTASLGCWVWANTGGNVRISVDAIGPLPSIIGNSPYHPGDSTWRWLVATLKVPADGTLTAVGAHLHVNAGGIVAYFSNPTFVEGSWCPHVLPSGIFLRSELLHLGSASGLADSVPGGSIFYGCQGGNITSALVETPAPFASLISNLRVYFANAPGSGKTCTAQLSVNGFLVPLSCTITELGTFNVDNANKVLLAAGDRLSLKITTTAGANVSVVRATCLIEETPLQIT